MPELEISPEVAPCSAAFSGQGTYSWQKFDKVSTSGAILQRIAICMSFVVDEPMPISPDEDLCSVTVSGQGIAFVVDEPMMTSQQNFYKVITSITLCGW